MIEYDSRIHISRFDPEELKAILQLYARGVVAEDRIKRYHGHVANSNVPLDMRDAITPDFWEMDMYYKCFAEMPENLMRQIELAWWDYMNRAYEILGSDRASRMKIEDIFQSTFQRIFLSAA